MGVWCLAWRNCIGGVICSTVRRRTSNRPRPYDPRTARARPGHRIRGESVMCNRLALSLAAAAAVSTLLPSVSSAQDRVLGLDVSYWQGEISQTGWNTAFSDSGGERKFVFIRSSRGGTTGLDQPQGTPDGGTTATLFHRYDDPRFVQNITRATNAGLMTSAYHFALPDIATNTGTDEANHFIEAAGA